MLDKITKLMCVVVGSILASLLFDSRKDPKKVPAEVIGHKVYFNRSHYIWLNLKASKDFMSYSELEETHMKPWVWAVTATYSRPAQDAELIRLAQALYPVRHFVQWILVYDASKKAVVDQPKKFNHIENLLKPFKLNYIILSANGTNPINKVGNPKGWRPKLKGLRFVEGNKAAKSNEYVYLMDDDNTYDSTIFHQMRKKKRKVVLWPTACVGFAHCFMTSPIVYKDTIKGYCDGWLGNRRFPTDFASIAFKVAAIRSKFYVPFVQSYQETKLLESLKTNFNEIAVISYGAAYVYTWHTKTRLRTIRNFLYSLPKLKALEHRVKNFTVDEETGVFSNDEALANHPNMKILASLLFI